MNRDKAHRLVDTIIDTQVEAVAGDPGRTAEALRTAKSDLHLMVDQIYGDFDAAADQAMGLLHETQEAHGAQAVEQLEVAAEHPEDRR